MRIRGRRRRLHPLVAINVLIEPAQEARAGSSLLPDLLHPRGMSKRRLIAEEPKLLGNLHLLLVVAFEQTSGAGGGRHRLEFVTHSCKHVNGTF